MENSINIQHQVVEIVHNFDDFTYNLETHLGLLSPEILPGLQSDAASTVGFLENLGGGDELVLFNIFEHGELLRLKGIPTKAKQYMVGNPVIALKMTREDIRAGLYAPLRMFVYENKQGVVIVEYDLPSSIFSQFNNEKINAVAKSLDEKLLRLIRSADSNQ